MLVKHKLKMELTGIKLTPYVEVMQYDQLSRVLEIAMYENGFPALMPENCRPMVRFWKPDGEDGIYDAMPDGGPAWYIKGNIVDVYLVPEVCTAAGIVKMVLELLDGESLLYSFPIEIWVKQNPQIKQRSRGYHHVTGFLPHPENPEIGEFIRVVEIDEHGHVIRTETAKGVSEEAVTQEELEKAIADYIEENGLGQGIPGENGKSAYEYAQDGGYTGTETEFAKKLASENAGIHIDKYPPTDENVKVWIDTDEEPEAPGTESGISVAAEVGQTIIVEEVDVNGNPTKWKAVDYQPKTHYSTFEEVRLIENATVASDGSSTFDFPIVTGQSYRVIWNGETYEEVAFEYEFAGILNVMIGNPAGLMGDDNGKPFCIVDIEGIATAAVSMDGTDAVLTLYVNQETAHPIPEKYIPDMHPYYVLILSSGNLQFTTTETVESLIKAVRSGRAVFAKVFQNDGKWAIAPLANYDPEMTDVDFTIGLLSVTLTANEDGTYSIGLKGAE